MNQMIKMLQNRSHTINDYVSKQGKSPKNGLNIKTTKCVFIIPTLHLPLWEFRGSEFNIIQPNKLLCSGPLPNLSACPDDSLTSWLALNARKRGHVEIKGSHSRTLVFPELHWLIYISVMCHWRNTHKLRCNQTGPKDWRAVNRHRAERLIDWSVNFFDTKMVHGLTHFEICASAFESAGYLCGGCGRAGCRSTVLSWLDFWLLGFHSPRSIKSPHFFQTVPLLPSLWMPDGKLRGNTWLSSSSFRAEPQLGS